MGVIWIVVDLLNILTLGWFAGLVTEDRIVRNIGYLKEEENSWFQELLANETYYSRLGCSDNVRSV